MNLIISNLPSIRSWIEEPKMIIKDEEPKFIKSLIDRLKELFRYAK